MSLASFPRSGRAIRVVFAVVLIAGLASCAAPAKRREMRVPVTVARADRRPVRDVIEATGTVEPAQTVAINPQVGGLVTAIRFREGDEVRRGQVLFEIDPRPFAATLEQARASLARDRALARTARLELERAEKLRDDRYISAQEYDARLAAADAAGAAARADSAQVAKAALDVDNCTIRSPLAGRSGNVAIHPGNLVRANTTDSPLVTIHQVRPILVRFTVPQQDLARVLRHRAERPAVFATGSNEDSSASQGVLIFVDNDVDPQSGSVLLKAEFPNRDGGLWPGEFVRVQLVLATEAGATVVPAQAVTRGQAGTFVYVIQPDTTVATRPVEVDRTAEGMAVIGSGLAVGEQVVVDGQLRLSPGAKIVVKPPPSATPARGGAAASTRRP